MLEALSVLGGTLVATESPNERSLQAGDLAARAEPYFSHVEPIADPHAARSRALALAGRAEEAGGEDAQAVLAGARRHGLLHVRQRGPGDQVTGQQSREKAGQVLGVGDDPSRRPREIRIGARVIEVP